MQRIGLLQPEENADLDSEWHKDYRKQAKLGTDIVTTNLHCRSRTRKGERKGARKERN